MPTIDTIKEYILKNKKYAIIVAALVLLLACSVSAAIFLKAKNTQNEMADTESFVVFENGAVSQGQQPPTANKQEMPVEIPVALETQQPGIDNNLLSQVPMENDLVTLNIRTGGRSNPFSPVSGERFSPASVSDIAEPPQYIPEENIASSLMKTTVSGILYNPSKSSAIIKVDDVDQLVSKGDKVGDFQVVDITRTKVYLKKGTNITAAGVGESIEEKVTYNNVYNLPNKFGGKYSTNKRGVILLNN